MVLFDSLLLSLFDSDFVESLDVEESLEDFAEESLPPLGAGLLLDLESVT